MVNLVMVLMMVVATVSTTTESENEMMRLAKRSLLKKLGLNREPRPSPGTLIPPDLLKLYQTQMRNEISSNNFFLPGRHTRSANTVRSFTHKGKEFEEKAMKKFRLKFETASIPSEERITSAEVRLTNLEEGRRVAVHDILKPGVKGEEGPLLRLLDSRIVQGGSVSLDVTDAAERWTTSENYGLLVEVDGSARRRKRDEYNLFIYTDDGKVKPPSLKTILSRAKRAAGRKHKRKETICRRHPLFVDFKLVGWDDWIVAPPGYDAYYCHGTCPFPLSDHLNTTNHAVLQNLYHSHNPSIPEPCCVPTQLSSISMLYLDEGQTVILKNYQEMVVEGCGCR